MNSSLPDSVRIRKNESDSWFLLRLSLFEVGNIFQGGVSARGMHPNLTRRFFQTRLVIKRRVSKMHPTSLRLFLVHFEWSCIRPPCSCIWNFVAERRGGPSDRGQIDNRTVQNALKNER